MKVGIEKKIEEIAKCIIDKIKETKPDKIGGLYDGEFGILLFLYYYSEYANNDDVENITNNYVESLLNKLGSNNSHTFCGGLSGILYLFELLREKGIVDIEISDVEESLNTFLINRIKRDLQINNFDFMHGALGGGLYFLKKKSHRKIIHEIIDSLYATAEMDNESGGLKWKSIIDFKNQVIGYNISLSHGMSSIVLFLCKALKLRINPNKSLKLINGSLKYILNQRIDLNQCNSLFPSFSIESDPEPLLGSRLAWCYGDLGVAYTLWNAGKAIDNKKWESEGLFILLESTKRQTKDQSRIIEAGICHGSAGLVMIYRRLYIETKNKLFLDAVHYWIQQTIYFAQFRNGLAGYKSLNINKWDNDYSLLGGIAGIGLSFISYLKEDCQFWDEVFLLQ